MKSTFDMIVNHNYCVSQQFRQLVYNIRTTPQGSTIIAFVFISMMNIPPQKNNECVYHHIRFGFYKTSSPILSSPICMKRFTFLAGAFCLVMSYTPVSSYCHHKWTNPLPVTTIPTGSQVNFLPGGSGNMPHVISRVSILHCRNT